MKKLTFALFITLFVHNFYGQEFNKSVDKLAWRDTIYIITNSGDSLSAFLHDFKKNKGCLTSLDIKWNLSSKKPDLSFDSIKFVYLKEESNNSSSFSFGALEKLVHGTSGSLIERGYGYFEKVLVQIKKDKEPEIAFMQLINRGFDQKIKIYSNPNPWKSTSGTGFGIGGVQLVEEKEITYYVKIVNSDKPAFLIRSKDIQKDLDSIFVGCPSLVEELKQKINFNNFPKYIATYNQCNQ